MPPGRPHHGLDVPMKVGIPQPIVIHVFFIIGEGKVHGPKPVDIV